MTQPDDNPIMEVKMLEALVKKKLYENQISSIISVDGKPAMQKGENYASVILRYRLETVLCSGEKSVKHLIVKTLPNSEKQVQFLQQFSFFKSEIHMYSTILKCMQKLMEEFEDRRDSLWCEMVAYTPYDFIVLEDLKDQNFEMMNRRENLDFEHSLLVMRTLGRYHAMTKILLKRQWLQPNEFPTFLFVHPTIVGLCFTSALTVLEEAVNKYWGDKWSHFPAILRKLKTGLEDKLNELIQIDESRFNVLNHGDCWTNNMLFKHVEGTKIPCSIKYIDYQLTHYNSFSWDLTYFLYNSTRPDVRRTKYKELLTAYHNALCYNLKYYNYKNNEDIPTMDDIMKEMDRLKIFGFLLLISIHAMTTADTTEAFDLEESLKNPDNPSIGVNIDIYSKKKYIDSIGEDIQLFIKNGII